MSAEILRRAVALMSSRFNGATSGPWSVVIDAETDSRRRVVSDFIATRYTTADPTVAIVTSPQYGDTDEAEWGQTEDAEHIASWHPQVAEAVADWLENVAYTVEHGKQSSDEYESALAVARAYLGNDA